MKPTAVDLTFPKFCTVCRREPGPGEEQLVGIVYAGDAWKDGVAEIKEGAVLFRTASYCAEHVPAEDENPRT